MTQLDPAGRVEYVDRRVSGDFSPLLRAEYTYYDNGLVQTVTFGNGAWIAYTYDDAGRVSWIDHRDMDNEMMLRLEYQYDGRDLVTKIIETWPDWVTIDNTYVYDDRGRLTGESRLFDPPYDYLYHYDDGGNRTRKEDLLTGDVIEYHYDYEDTTRYGPAGNRLMYYETFEAGNPDPVSRTYYYYNNDANVTRVVTEKTTPDPGEKQYTATWLNYATNGQAVAHVVGEQWDWGGQASCVDGETYEITYAREFGYDEPRQRYANRELNIYKPENAWIIEVVSTIWSDYAASPGRAGNGDSIYGDYTVEYSPTTVTEATAHEPGIGRVDNPHEVPGNQVYRFYHTDHLGTTRLTTAYYATSAQEQAVYSAFGELLDGTNHRYGYVGKEGYQAHDEFPFLHVGARYYDPGSGRFLQRDPIGLAAGLNVYRYVRNRPTLLVDANGLAAFDSFEEFVDEFKENVATGAAVGGVGGTLVGGIAGAIPGSAVPGAGTLVGAGGGAVAGGGAGAIVGGACGGFYTVGQLLTPIVDWFYSDDFEEGAKAPTFGQGGRFGGRGGGASW